VRLAVERAVGAMISFYWFPQIVRPVRVFWFTGLLGGKSSLTEITVEPTWRKLIADDGLDSWPASINFSP
jgi:hypothetical protein